MFGELELAGRMTCIGNSSSWRGSLIRKERAPPAQSCRLPRLITTREGATACEQEHIPTLHLKGPVGCLTSTRGKLKTLYSSGQLTHTGRRSDQQLQRAHGFCPSFYALFHKKKKHGKRWREMAESICLQALRSKQDFAPYRAPCFSRTHRRRCE